MHQATDCPQADRAVDPATALELDLAEEDFLVASQEYQADFNTDLAAGDTSMKAASQHCTHQHCTHHHCTHIYIHIHIWGGGGLAAGAGPS